MKKVMIAGHICLDITPMFEANTTSNNLNLLSPGKLIHVGNADVSTGGAVANTGLAMKFLGCDVRLAGKIGDDQFGDIIHNFLATHHCEEGLIIEKNMATSYSIVIAMPGVDRIFLHNPGTNNTFCSKDITDKMLEDISHFHFGYPPLMQTVYRNNGEELITIFKRIKEKGITTSLDMAAIDANTESGSIDWRAILEQVLPYVDFFVPSIEELCFMLDKDLYATWQQKANGCDIVEVITLDEVKQLANQLIRMGTKEIGRAHV